MATGRDMRARLVLTLRDGVSPGLDRIPGRLERIRNAIGRISMAAAVIAGVSFLGPAQQAAAFEDGLRQAAITAGATGAAVEAMIQRNRVAFERLALATGQRSRDIATAAANMIAAGMSDEQITRLLPTIARVATASGASMDDLAMTAFQLQQQLGITADQMPRAFAALVAAGKEGNFELRDMAREFPNLLSMAKALGMQGPGAVASLASALQVARTAAGSSGEAANNLLNALQKIAAPETRRAFAEIGVDLEAVLRDAAARGINPLEAVLEKLRQRTGGDLMKLSSLFGDRQALMGLLPLLQQVDTYLRTRDAAAAAGTDAIDADFASRMRGAQMQLALFFERMEQLGRRFMLALLGAMQPVLDASARMMDWIAWLDAVSPGLVDGVLGWAGGLIIAAAAVGVLGQVLSFLAAGLTVFLTGIELVLSALMALFGGPVALAAVVVATLAGAAYLVWRNWGTLGPLFGALWDSVRSLFAGFGAWVAGWASWAMAGGVTLVQGAWDVLTTWFGTLWGVLVIAPFDAFVAWVDGWSGGAMSAAIERIREIWAPIGMFFSDLWSGVLDGFRRIWGDIIAAIEQVAEYLRGARDQPPAPGGLSDPEAQQRRRRNFGGRGRMGGLYDGDTPEGFRSPEGAVRGRDGRAEVGGEIVIRAAPGTEVLRATPSDPRVRFDIDRGAVLGAP